MFFKLSDFIYNIPWDYKLLSLCCTVNRVKRMANHRQSNTLPTRFKFISGLANDRICIRISECIPTKILCNTGGIKWEER